MGLGPGDLVDASARPRTPAQFALWIVGAPFLLHLLCVLLFGMEADTSTEVLFAVMFAAASTGGAYAKLGFNLALAAAATAWPPALFAWRRWYWAMDMHSPGGAAQGLVGLLGWKDAPAPWALASVAAVSSAPGWLLLRLDRWHENRTGRSFFDDD